MQTYYGLKKSWIGYLTAINDDDQVLSESYAASIQKFQRELGVRISDFSWLGLSAAGEEENLAKYIPGEVTGDEPIFDEEQEQEVDPLYAYKEEKEPDYEFIWKDSDIEKTKRFGL
jgi:hypothetical protein